MPERNFGWPIFQDDMALLPVHFQQLIRSAETLTQVPLGDEKSAGFLSLALSDQLHQGTLSLTRCVAIFPDGTWLRLPEYSECVALENLDQTLSGVESADVWLTIGARDGAPFLADTAGGPARFRRHKVAVSDDFEREREPDHIELLRRDVALRITHGNKELPAGLVKLPVARIVYSTSEQRLVLSTRYVPPCLTMQPLVLEDTRHLQAFRSLVDTLIRRIESSKHGVQADVLAVLTRASASGVDTSYLHDLLRLRALSTQLATIHHYRSATMLHPALLFAELLRLHEELRVLVPQYRETPPSYRHGDLYGCFEQLQLQIMQLLEQRGACDHQRLSAEKVPSERNHRVARFTLPGGSFLDRGRMFVAFKGFRNRADACSLLSDRSRLKVGPANSSQAMRNSTEEGIPCRVRDAQAKDSADMPRSFKELSWYEKDVVYVEIRNLSEFSRSKTDSGIVKDFQQQAWKTIEQSKLLEVRVILDKEQVDDELRIDHMLITLTEDKGL